MTKGSWESSCRAFSSLHRWTRNCFEFDACLLRARIGLMHVTSQPAFRICPFRIEDAEINCVSDPAGVRDQVAAECAFLFCSDAKNRVARFLIKRIRL